ncbi:type I restriction enzyme, S subunit [Peribacillus simplex]|uniref:Type I restriction enzyme, S subunit n=1 Tax=Peribacillus simplex TaxID=1478 RepID=A0A9X8RDX4_9BACI|nr:restriction endonuclease subunit S [Peribacillus simplex]SIS04167.1 type I restriction enzyme, S subunit [Peribacillus simplex]
MNAQDLKNSILQLAIQGKLVQQREKEGAAKELIKMIKVEKEQLINEGKIRREKPFPKINEDEIPFDVPENWEWVRFGDLGSYKKGPFGSALTKSMFVPKGTDTVKVYEQKNAIQKSVDLGDYYITREYFESKMKGFELLPGDIIVSCAGTIGETYVMPTDFEQGIINQALMQMKLMPSVYVEYFLLYFDFILKKTARKSSKGSAIKNIPPFQELKNYVVPLPPLEEQKRIVAKIEELMPYVEKYDKAYFEVEELNKKFPEDMQKSILQYAIQGKLVEQRKEEGTAEELYQQIQEQKEKLIKEGKIKKTKNLPEITEDEILFDIPENWKWARFSEVIDVRDGTHDTPAYVSNGYPLITGKDFYNGYFELSKTQYVSENDYKEISKRSNVEVGDILFSMIGGNIGSMILIEPQNYFEMAIKNVALFKQYTPNMIMSKYLMYYLKSQVSRMKANASGGAQAFVSLTVLRSYLLPLPPLDEQKRIVEKIEELLPYTEKLVK